MIKDLTSLILKHTLPSRRHLTPELVLRLVTPSCPLWRATEEEMPFADPFWAFYWPGGQATARYILDNGDKLKNLRVLDIGCGCGAGGIAAAKIKAKHVLANDIDGCAIIATKINAAINNVTIDTSTDNLIGDKCDDFDAILIGDMFYDEGFANSLFEWLRDLCHRDKIILIGDPGRHGLTEKRRNSLRKLATYKLAEESCLENRGFSDATVWQLLKD